MQWLATVQAASSSKVLNIMLSCDALFSAALRFAVDEQVAVIYRQVYRLSPRVKLSRRSFCCTRPMPNCFPAQRLAQKPIMEFARRNNFQFHSSSLRERAYQPLQDGIWSILSAFPIAHERCHGKRMRYKPSGSTPILTLKIL